MSNGPGLNERILAAHDEDDSNKLAELYHVAGEDCIESGKIDAGCFFLTQSFIFALESGNIVADLVRSRLVELGRER